MVASSPREVAFWVRVNRSGGPDACWPWLGARSGNGYGAVKFGGTQFASHRVAYDFAHPNDPLGQRLGCHTCDNPICCNPAHVFPGTPLANARDRNLKGRHAHGRDYTPPEHRPRGSGHPDARLTEDQVAGIRRRFEAGERQVDIARSVGVSKELIHRIIHRRTWRHVA